MEFAPTVGYMDTAVTTATVYSALNVAVVGIFRLTVLPTEQFSNGENYSGEKNKDMR